MSIIGKLRGEPPTITEQDTKCAMRIAEILESSLCPLVSVRDDEEAVREILNDGGVGHAIALEIADSREVAMVERVGEKIICWIVMLTVCAVLTLVGSAVAVQIASN